MIKLSDLLSEDKTFTAINKDSGETSVFKSKDSRDAAVKAGTHDKKEKEAEKGGDSAGKKEKPNMFSKDAGYDAPDSPKKEPKSEPTKLKYGKDGKMTQDSADSVEKELNKALGVNGMSDIDLNTGTIEYVIDNDPDKIIFIGKEEGGEGIAVSFGDGGDEYKTFKNSKDAVAYAKELGQTFKGEEPKKDEPTKDSTKERAGNPKVNKVVSGKAKKLGITPQKLGKEEYEKRMTQAAVEALTDANFHSDARKLISVLEDNPEFAKDPNQDPKKPKDIFSDEYDEWRKSSVYSSTFYDSSEGTDDIAHSATGESGWDGVQSLDAIAYDLKMNGSKKLAAKLQSIFESNTSKGFKNHKIGGLQ